MTKTIKKLEKDKSSLIKKCEATDVALIDMAEEVFFPKVTRVSKAIDFVCSEIITAAT